jgi:hypothetical protein
VAACAVTVAAARRRRRWRHGKGGAAGSKGRHGPCRVVRVCERPTSWPPRVAACRQQGGTVAVSGVHARAQVLASQDRGVAVPCAGHRHPEPTARRGGGGSDGGCGSIGERRAPAQDKGRVLGLFYGWFICSARHLAGSRGMGAVSGGSTHRRGSPARGCDAVAGWRKRVESVQDAQLRWHRRSGAGLVKLWGVASSSSSHSSSSSLPSLLLVRQRQRESPRELGFRGCGCG